MDDIVKFLDFEAENNNHHVTFGVVRGKLPFIYIGDRYSLIDERKLTEEEVDEIVNFLLTAKEMVKCPSSV